MHKPAIYISVCDASKAYLLLFWPLRLWLRVTSFVSFHGSALLYAECVGSDLNVRSICSGPDKATANQDPNRDYD